MPLLEASHVSVDIPTEDGVVHAVQDVSFEVRAGEMFGIVGESGSGKSVLTQAMMGLLPGADITGSVLFNGEDLLSLTAAQLRQVRGRGIGMIFQDPLSSLHPYFKIGPQIAEMIHLHERVSKKAARERVVATSDCSIQWVNGIVDLIYCCHDAQSGIEEGIFVLTSEWNSQFLKFDDGVEVASES